MAEDADDNGFVDALQHPTQTSMTLVDHLTSRRSQPLAPSDVRAIMAMAAAPKTGSNTNIATNSFRIHSVEYHLSSANNPVQHGEQVTLIDHGANGSLGGSNVLVIASTEH